MTKAEFVERMVKATQIAKQKGAILNTHAVIAQAALESGWGNSSLAYKYNNLFGIKRATDWKGEVVALKTFEYRGGHYVPEIAFWTVFPSWNECLVYYSTLIQSRWWFRDAIQYADPPAGNGDAMEWIAHLVNSTRPGELKWATSPDYVHKVIDLVGTEIEAILKPQEARA